MSVQRLPLREPTEPPAQVWAKYHGQQPWRLWTLVLTGRGDRVWRSGATLVPWVALTDQRFLAPGEGE